ncbi:uncharacterized protein RCC_02128 [Ramularia collo-cygni]|uniref:BTB domain-containing protein n=1 Tax=Ramularia collo-cygni TaxID=112498 RepID=A0A2D3UYM1_9PEZI|nr:uncharacterized protein RCC_02128 [Ramularia collo-cygni]CZT16286.1 uncharacterized protein RCC_02128 [Ramularia collo-cygni]
MSKKRNFQLGPGDDVLDADPPANRVPSPPEDVSVMRATKKSKTAAAPSLSPKKLSLERLKFTGKMVTVQVGMDGELPFLVHEPIIKPDSDFFRLVLDTKWREGQELLVKLPEDCVHIFATYVEWLYNKEVTAAHYHMLARMYVLGEKIQSSGFCNAVMENMIKRSRARCPVPIDMIRVIYDGTMTAAPVRTFVVDTWMSLGSTVRLTEEPDGTQPHPEFVMDLAMALLREHNDGKRKTCEEKVTWFK